jgi:hypothetical protein
MKLTTDFSQAARLRIQLCGMLLKTEITLLEPYLFMNVSLFTGYTVHVGPWPSSGSISRCLCSYLFFSR